MNQNEVRYTSLPATWPPNSIVFIDFPSGITKKYTTDDKGVPSFVSQYQNTTTNVGSSDNGYFPRGW